MHHANWIMNTIPIMLEINATQWKMLMQKSCSNHAIQKPPILGWLDTEQTMMLVTNTSV